MVVNDLVISTVGVILFSYILLKLFYKVFELNWPELYFSVNDKTALFVSVSWQRFVAFRFVPFFFAITFSTVVFLRNYGSVENIRAAILSALFYSLFTDGKAIYQLLTKSTEIKTYFNYKYQVILHIIIVILLLLTSILSALSAQTYLIKAITPSLQGLVDNIWSSLFVVLLAFYLKQIYSQEGLFEDILFRRSQENIAPSIFHAIDTYSSREQANPVLVKAICIAENLQRPPWVRRIESFTSRLRTEGSYGIMQVRNKKDVSDIESVEIVVKKYFKNTQGQTDVNQLRKIIKTYNNDDRYVDIVFKIMTFLDYSSARWGI